MKWAPNRVVKVFFLCYIYVKWKATCGAHLLLRKSVFVVRSDNGMKGAYVTTSWCASEVMCYLISEFALLWLHNVSVGKYFSMSILCMR